MRHEADVRRNSCVLDCGSPLPLSLRNSEASLFQHRFKIIRHLQAINFKAINGLHHGCRNRALKPSRRAPWILVRHRYQAMFHRILMDIIKAREMGLWVSKPRFPKVEPDSATGCTIELIDPLSGLNMKHPQHVRKISGIRHIQRRMGDKMVMIREHGPRLEPPAEIAGHGQQAAM